MVGILRILAVIVERNFESLRRTLFDNPLLFLLAFVMAAPIALLLAASTVEDLVNSALRQVLLHVRNISGRLFNSAIEFLIAFRAIRSFASSFWASARAFWRATLSDVISLSLQPFGTTEISRPCERRVIFRCAIPSNREGRNPYPVRES